MAETFKDKAQDAGHKIAEAATRVGHRIGEKAEEVADWAKEKAHEVGNRVSETAQAVEHRTGMNLSGSKTTADITEHMEVYASCGTLVGKVDHVEGGQIKLTKNDSPDGSHHLIPMSWVKKVDSHVHLDRNHVAVQQDWMPA